VNSPNREIYQTVEDQFDFSWVPLMMTGPHAGKQPIELDWSKHCKTRQPYFVVDHYKGNLGITTGRASGIIVLDVDEKKKFHQFCQDNGLEIPETFTVSTGRDEGHHLYFLRPTDDLHYSNRANKQNGFDIRGDGGQVVAPGSWHVKKEKYYEVEKFIDLAPAPQWLLDYSRKGDLPGQQKQLHTPATAPAPTTTAYNWNGDISRLPVKPYTKDLITSGVSVGQRSEAMMTVINALVWSDITDTEIFGIFEQYPIGDKYREKGTHREKWLQPQIEKARLYVTNRAEAPQKILNDDVTGETVFLPGGGVKINDAGRTLGKLLAARFFTRNGETVEVI